MKGRGSLASKGAVGSDQSDSNVISLDVGLSSCLQGALLQNANLKKIAIKLVSLVHTREQNFNGWFLEARRAENSVERLLLIPIRGVWASFDKSLISLGNE